MPWDTPVLAILLCMDHLVLPPLLLLHWGTIFLQSIICFLCKQIFRPALLVHLHYHWCILSSRRIWMFNLTLLNGSWSSFKQSLLLVLLLCHLSLFIMPKPVLHLPACLRKGTCKNTNINDSSTNILLPLSSITVTCNLEKRNLQEVQQYENSAAWKSCSLSPQCDTALLQNLKVISMTALQSRVPCLLTVLPNQQGFYYGHMDHLETFIVDDMEDNVIPSKSS